MNPCRCPLSCPNQYQQKNKNQQPPRNSNTLVHLDGLRGFAALFVACSHILARAWGVTDPQTTAGKIWAKFSPMSHFAVTAFIILSGYCLMLPLLKSNLQFKNGVSNFFARRFWRIAPAFYAAVILSVLLATRMAPNAFDNMTSPSHPVTATMIGAHLVFLQTVIPHGSLPYNGVLWSVGVEWWIYFFFPVLLLLWRRFQNGVAVTLAVTVAFYGLFYLVAATPLGGFHFEYFAMFSLGVLCADITHGSLKQAATRIPSAAWLAVSLLFFVVNFGVIAKVRWSTGQHYAHLFDLVFGLFFGALLIFTAQAPRHLITRFFSSRPLALLGTFAYSLYLVHYPLANIFEAYVIPLFGTSETTRLLAYLLLCIPLVCGVSYFFYFLIERPSALFSQKIKKAVSESPALAD